MSGFRLKVTRLCCSADRVRVRGAGGAGAGGHRDGEAGRIPHLGRLLAATHPGNWLNISFEFLLAGRAATRQPLGHNKPFLCFSNNF